MKNKFNFSRRNPKTKKIENTGFMEFRNVSNNAADLYIYGDIVSSTWEAWCDEDTCPQDISDFMNQIEPGAELTVYINSGGGDVFAGIAIHSILSRHTGHKTGIVDGMAASIASVILMACDSIVMSSGAQIMIHKPLSWAYGNADDFQRLISISIHAPARGATSILSKIHPMFLTISHNASSFSSFPFHSFLPHLLNSSTFCALFQVRISRAFSVYYRFAPKKSTPDL